MLDPETGIDFPFYQKQCMEMFGQPDEDGPFARDYLAIIDLGEFAMQLSHVLDYTGALWSHRIYANYVLEGPLKKAFGMIVAGGLEKHIHSFDGCFNIRRMRGSGAMSIHSWGLALDFNAGENAFGQPPTMNMGIVECFHQSGFEWGGLWRTPDGMHFQLPWTKDWRRVPGGPVPFVRD